VNIVVSDPKIDAVYKYYASLISTVAVIRGSSVFADFEILKGGLDFKNFGTPVDDYSFENCLLIMVVSFFLFLIIGLYLDNVFPSVYGLRKKPWFFLKPSYWWKLKGTSNNTSRTNSSGSKLSDGRSSGGALNSNTTTSIVPL
jgi:hypothetical protein